MNVPDLGSIQWVNPRKIWPDEASDFTPWVAENIGLLSEAIGIDIEIVDREVAVGDFRVDLVGKQIGTGLTVIIENQLETTNNTHLGQILAYAAGLDAEIVVWVSPKFKDEHQKAIEWLNAHSSEKLSFFAVEVEALRVDDSRPAVTFKVVARPSDWKQSPQVSERQRAYHEFFVALLNQLKSKSPGYTSSQKVGYDSWMSFGAGRSGFAFNPAFAEGRVFRVELYVDGGDRDINKRRFDALMRNKQEIEASLGFPLRWERLEERQACRVYAHRDASIESPPEALKNLRAWAVETLIKFREVFGPRVKELRLDEESDSG